jgi:hypothetical protein
MKHLIDNMLLRIMAQSAVHPCTYGIREDSSLFNMLLSGTIGTLHTYVRIELRCQKREEACHFLSLKIMAGPSATYECTTTSTYYYTTICTCTAYDIWL